MNTANNNNVIETEAADDAHEMLCDDAETETELNIPPAHSAQVCGCHCGSQHLAGEMGERGWRETVSLLILLLNEVFLYYHTRLTDTIDLWVSDHNAMTS